MSQVSQLNISKTKRVVVAMSGGVDSSVAAAVCAKQGYDVVGITLQLYSSQNPSRKKGACCAGQDIYDAKKVADKVGIKHYVLDYEEQFRSAVIDDFTDSYQNGLTPIPLYEACQVIVRSTPSSTTPVISQSNFSPSTTEVSKPLYMKPWRSVSMPIGSPAASSPT